MKPFFFAKNLNCFQPDSSRITAFFMALLPTLCFVACDQETNYSRSILPIDVDAGAIIVIQPTPTSGSSRFADVQKIIITFDRVEAVVDDQGIITVDTRERSVIIENTEDPVYVGQFPVPSGTLRQLRIFPKQVSLLLQDDVEITLDPDTSNLPSWKQTGLKISPQEQGGFVIPSGGLTGIRVLLVFDDWLVRAGKPASSRWKLKPSLPAQQFDPQPTGPGFLLDRVVVVFHQSTSITRINEINDEIGATIVRFPILSNWYEMRIPPTISVMDALDYYRAQSDVVAAIPSVSSYQPSQFSPNDPEADSNFNNFEISSVPDAWETLVAHGRPIGNPAVEVAVFDTGVDLAHRDIYRNIGINQGELPAALFDADGDEIVSKQDIISGGFDCDPVEGDGLISIRDLECAPLNTIQPSDSNNNNRIDGFDILSDPRWANGIDEDDWDADPDTYRDDLVGWNFYNNTNVPAPTGDDMYRSHGTEVSGVIAAEGNNGVDIAGVNWRASLVPLVMGSTTSVAEGFAYLDRRSGIDVVNISAGFIMVRNDVDLEFMCGEEPRTLQFGYTPQMFDVEVQNFVNAYATLFLDNATNTLYTFSAGNDHVNLDTDGIFDILGGGFRMAFPGNTLVVGATEDGEITAYFSNHGQSSVDIYAPGVAWRTIIPDDALSTSQGTSFAAPTVAGSAALLAAEVPEYRDNGRQLRIEILGTAERAIDPDSCLQSTFNDALLLDTQSLMVRHFPPLPPPPPDDGGGCQAGEQPAEFFPVFLLIGFWLSSRWRMRQKRCAG